MRSLYTLLLVLHVLIAVLGAGSVSGIALVAATARRTGQTSAQIFAWLSPLLRYSAFSLAAMFVTGILLDVAAHGAFHPSWWFRGSVILLVATGALHGRTRRVIRSGNAGTDVLQFVQRAAFGMCVLIGVITMLMEAKPF